jgi:hypothetical protein
MLSDLIRAREKLQMLSFEPDIYTANALDVRPIPCDLGRHTAIAVLHWSRSSNVSAIHQASGGAFKSGCCSVKVGFELRNLELGSMAGSSDTNLQVLARRRDGVSFAGLMIAALKR